MGCGHPHQANIIDLLMTSMGPQGSEVAPGLVVSVIQEAGEGLPLWQQLEELDSAWSSDGGLGSACQRTLRLVCKGLRDISYPFVTSLQQLVLGGEEYDEFTDDTARWPAEQHTLQRQVSTFLQRLPHLQYLTVRMHAGSASQMVQLLNQGCFATSLRSIDMVMNSL